MPRRARSLLESQAACYHIINRGHARETIFHDDADLTRFLTLLMRYRDAFDLRIYHYCLMGNHFHLLVQLPEAKALSRCVAGLLVAYWHYYRRRYGLVGHLFQGRFKSPAIEADEYLLSCGRYIERNPVEAEIVAEPWQYEWSSCSAYALGRPNGLLARNPWYEGLAPDPAARARRWREFILGEDAKAGAVRRDDWIIGAAAFRQQMQRTGARPTKRGRGRPIASSGPAMVPGTN
jgi:putative transposase